VEYQNVRIWRTTWDALSKVRALLLTKENKRETLMEIVNRLVLAELARLESKK
jgi:hypothetical protein